MLGYKVADLMYIVQWPVPNFFLCAMSSIPNMEKMNLKYLIMTKDLRTIIFMRGGFLSFSTDKGLK